MIMQFVRFRDEIMYSVQYRLGWHERYIISYNGAPLTVRCRHSMMFDDIFISIKSFYVYTKGCEYTLGVSDYVLFNVNDDMSYL